MKAKQGSKGEGAQRKRADGPVLVGDSLLFDCGVYLLKKKTRQHEGSGCLASAGEGGPTNERQSAKVVWIDVISRHIRVKWHFRTVKWLHPRLDPLPLPEYIDADSSAGR